MMLIFLAACARNDYSSETNTLQFSLTDAQQIEFDTRIEKKLSYRHRPTCVARLSMDSLNFGDSDATITMDSDFLDSPEEVVIAPSMEGEPRSLFIETYSIPCRNRTYGTTVRVDGTSEVLINFSTTVQATLVEPGDWGILDFSNPRVLLQAEYIVISHTEEE